MTDYANMDFPEGVDIHYEVEDTEHRIHRFRKCFIERNLLRAKIKVDDNRWEDIWINMAYVITIRKREKR